MAKASDGEASLEKNSKDSQTPKGPKEKKVFSGEATLLAPWLDHLVELEMMVPDYPPIQGRLVAMSRYELFLHMGDQKVVVFKHAVLSVRKVNQPKA